MLDSRAYYDLRAPKLISWEFFSNYIEVEPPFGELGLIVFLRTYSRFVPELGRREKWCETILRVVEYSLSLDTVSTVEDKRQEAEDLFDCVFNMRGFPAGRSLWMAGSETAVIDPSANWNCTLRVIDSISAFSEIFYWLLIGAGTGFSVETKYIEQLPEFNTNFTTKHDDYDYFKGDYPNTTVYLSSNQLDRVFTKQDLVITSDSDYLDTSDIKPNTAATIICGDSKEGWCNALRVYLTLLTCKNITSILFNYDYIRPQGSRIKVFGGRASGYLAVKQLFEFIEFVVKRDNGKLTSVGVLDIVNAIGRNVVSGGVRRTAEIALGSSTDKDFIEAKKNLYTDPAKEVYRPIRTMSNNSILEYGKLSLEQILEVMDCIKTNGDPAFWNIGNSQKLAESPVDGTNPLTSLAA